MLSTPIKRSPTFNGIASSERIEIPDDFEEIPILADIVDQGNAHRRRRPADHPRADRLAVLSWKDAWISQAVILQHQLLVGRID